MSHPIRKWLKETLQYGRRGIQTPADGKPPLLWLADLPRLGRMWLGRLWFRTWLDLRSIPPRVRFAPREILSPHVRLIRPGRLRPLRPFTELRAAWARCDGWLAAGGLGRVLARLGGGVLEGLLGLLGGIAIGLMAVIGAGLSFLAGLAGISAIGTALGLNSLGQGVSRLAGGAGAAAATLLGGMGAAIGSLWNGVKTPQELAWTFATVTGTVGLILLMVLQSAGLSGVEKPPILEIKRVVNRPPRTFAPPTQTPAEEPHKYANLPDPFGPPPEPVEEPAPTPELVIALERAELPPEVARFNLPASEEMFLVESAAPELIDPQALPADDWLRALPEDELSAEPIIPASYRETLEPTASVSTAPEPQPQADQFTPATRGLGVTIEKRQPRQAAAGEVITYELIVTNQGQRPLSHVTVEERVDPPHRVATADPAAEYHDGVLTWQFDSLEPGESRTLQVGVYPMSAKPIATAATVRPMATFSTATYVQEADQEPEPGPLPMVEPEPTPPPNVYRRIKIAMTTPKALTNGSPCDVELVVTNTGTVPLTGVVLRSVLPTELRHPQGETIETPIGSLAPGESRATTLRVVGHKLGTPNLMAEVSATEGIATSVRGSFEIVDQLVAQGRILGPCGSFLGGITVR